MKRKFKKAVAVVLTMAMTMSVGVPAFAEEESETTIIPFTHYDIQNQNLVSPQGQFFEDTHVATLNIMQKNKIVAIARLETDYRYGDRKIWVTDARASISLYNITDGATTEVIEADSSPEITKISDNEYLVTANYRLERLYLNGDYEISTPTLTLRFFANSTNVRIETVL